MVSVILLDIEGTTSSVSFVYDVLFPYARKNLRQYLERHWGEAELTETCKLIIDSGGIDDVEREVIAQMDRDAKLTGLKQLQGRIWQSGFKSGEIKAHVYQDTPTALKRWTEGSKRVFIYSSGSIEAQKLFFRYTIAGDLSGYLSGYFDTTSGGKREPQSYANILHAISATPEEVLFISDVEEELDAAGAAGVHTALAVRDTKATNASDSRHRVIESFDQV